MARWRRVLDGDRDLVDALSRHENTRLVRTGASGLADRLSIDISHYSGFCSDLASSKPNWRAGTVFADAA